jgi:hypothetical protein
MLFPFDRPYRTGEMPGQCVKVFTGYRHVAERVEVCNNPSYTGTIDSERRGEQRMWSLYLVENRVSIEDNDCTPRQIVMPAGIRRAGARRSRQATPLRAGPPKRHALHPTSRCR